MLWWFFACVAPSDSADASPVSPEAPADPEALPGAGADTAGDTGEAPDDEYGCEPIYGGDVLPAYDLEISDLEWARLEGDYASGRKDYHEAVLHHDGEAVAVQVRLKGNPSFSWLGDKLQLVVAFNQVDADARWNGLRKLVFDAPWYDATLVRERLGWEVMRTRGDIPALCANNATLSVNGEPYGVYAHLESFDREYLERVFGEEAAGGTLYKYGTDAVANAEAADAARLAAFHAADTVEEMQAVGDLAAWVRMWAAETALGDDDGYVCCNHNFAVYDHPTDGMLYVPWDFDDTLELVPYDTDPVTGYGRAGLYQQTHFRVAMADPAWRARYVDEVEAMAATMDPARVSPLLAAWGDQLAEAVAADPMRTWGDEEREQTRARLDAWVAARHTFLASWVACERGESGDADGDGLDVCHDKDDTTPVGPEQCNGRDDDNDGDVDEEAGCDDCARHDLDDQHFLFCSDRRSATDAEALCAARGGTLASLSTTESWYLAYFWTWPDAELWWLAGRAGSSCAAWDEGSLGSTTAPCGDLHRAICAVP